MKRYIFTVIILGLLVTGCGKAKLVESRYVGTVVSAQCLPGGISADRTTVVTAKMSVSLIGCRSVALGEDSWVSRYDDGLPLGRQCWFYTAGISYPCA